MITQDVQQRIDAYRGNPQALMQRYQQSQQLIDLLALQKIKSEKEAAAREMQLKMAQAQPDMPTVAEQREQEVMDLTRQEVAQRVGQTAQQQAQQQQKAMQQMLSGIARAPGAQAAMTPQAMAAGGIVAFQAGGETEEGLTEEERQRIRDFEADETRRLMRRYPRPEPRTLAERQDRLREEKGSIYSRYFGMTPSERERAKMLERGLPEVLERQRSIPSAIPPAIERARAGLEALRGQGSFEEYARQASQQPRAELQPGVEDRREEEALRFPGAPGGGPARGAPAGGLPTVPTPRMTLPPARDQGLAGLIQQAGQPARASDSPLGTAVETAILADLGTDIAAAGKRRRVEAAGFIGYPEAERKAILDRMAQLERLDEERFGSEARRRRAFEDFVAGAMSSSTLAGSLGAGAGAVTAGGRALEEEQRKALQGQLERRRGFMEKERELRERIYGAGLGEEKEREATRRGAITAGGTLEQQRQQGADAAANRANQLMVAGINRESAERIAQFQADAQLENAKATRELTREQATARISANLEKAERDALEHLYRRSPEGEAYTALMKQKAEPGGLMKGKEGELARLAATLRQAEDKIRKDFTLQRSQYGITGGFELVGVK